MNLFDDILRMRIEKAKDYMRTTEMKIYEISEAVGFEDTGYFPEYLRNIPGCLRRSSEVENVMKTCRNRIWAAAFVLGLTMTFRPAKSQEEIRWSLR